MRIEIPGIESMKNDLLIGVDLQNDFANGALGNSAIRATIPGIAKFIRDFPGDKVLTMDSHEADTYLDTVEGRHLPVVHTVPSTAGFCLVQEVQSVLDGSETILEKSTFGCPGLAAFLKDRHYGNIYLIGWDTGYCVISNAILAKTFCPGAEVHVIEPLCACATPETHETALRAMATLHIDIIRPIREQA